jgi:hypothetical protein
MSFYLQHGYGKSDRIHQLSELGSLQGVILSPGDEDRTKLAETVSSAASRGLDVLLDPQTYIYTSTPPGTARCHSGNGIEFPVRWAQSSSDTARQIEAIGALTREVGASTYVAPTCLQPSFQGVWTPLGLQYAHSAIEQWGGESTYATLAFDQSALSDWEAVSAWLDEATQLDVKGFYVMVDRRPRSFPPVAWDQHNLTNLLRLLYTLALNEYDIIWGYTEFEGLLGQAVGVQTLASGWHYSLRQFSVAKWQPSPAGGAVPIPRLAIPALFAHIRAEEEGRLLSSLAYGDKILPPELLEVFAEGSQRDWPRRETQDRFLLTMGQLANCWTDSTPISDRINGLQLRLAAAIDLYKRIERSGVILDPRSYGLVYSFSGALADFRRIEAL